METEAKEGGAMRREVRSVGCERENGEKAAPATAAVRDPSVSDGKRTRQRAVFERASPFNWKTQSD